MKIKYHGTSEKNQTPNPRIVVITETPDKVTTERLRYIGNSEPANFPWGYCGSGPANLAISILTDYCKRTGWDPDLAQILYRDFRWDFIDSQPGKLCITDQQIEHWLQEKVVIV